MIRKPGLPKYKKFDFQPRFYDPEKEKLEQRQRWTEAEERVKALQKEEELNPLTDNEEENSILRGSFGRAKKKRKTLFGNMSVLLLVALLGGAAYVFIHLGSSSETYSWKVYVLLLLIPIYVLFRIRANSKFKKGS